MNVRCALVGVASLVAIAFAASPTQAQEVSRTARVSPVRLTYTDLAGLVVKAHEFVRVANASAKQEIRRESMTVKGALASLKLEDDFSAKAFEDAPPVAYSVRYYYESPEAPISSIDLDLEDFSREITVQGRSPDQVLALLAVLTENLREHETIMGGPWFRILLPLLTIIGLTVFLAIRFRQSEFVALIFYLGMVVWGISLFALPWERWAPGTAVYPENASFLQAHSALFSLIGMLVGMLGVVLPTLRGFLGSKPVSPTKARKG